VLIATIQEGVMPRRFPWGNLGFILSVRAESKMRQLLLFRVGAILPDHSLSSGGRMASISARRTNRTKFVLLVVVALLIWLGWFAFVFFSGFHDCRVVSGQYVCGSPRPPSGSDIGIFLWTPSELARDAAVAATRLLAVLAVLVTLVFGARYLLRRVRRPFN
jgi:hypothetical protein